MNASSTDRIEKEIQLAATPERVWRALTDSAEFGTWFKVALEGDFRLGETIQGKITYPGCEHMTFIATVERMEPMSAFAIRWNHDEPDTEPGSGPTTKVEFLLEPKGEGTFLRIIESGFDALPAEMRSEAWVRNEKGWTIQLENIARHVEG